jgi:hypothetical protein
MRSLTVLLAMGMAIAASQPERVPISRAVGCLSQASDGAWMLTDATEPAIVAGKPGSKEAA